MSSADVPRLSGPLDAVIDVEPGETKDLGDVRLADENEFTAKVPEVAASQKDKTAGRQAVVTGRVTLAGGQPGAGAHVAAVAMPIKSRRGGDLSGSSEVLGEATADAEGNYRLTLPVAGEKKYHSPSLVARLDGYGLAWESFSPNAPPTEASFSLVPERPIRGRLVDIEGQPAAGVRLEVRSVVEQADEDGQFGARAGLFGDVRTAAWPSTVASDDQGRFTLHGVSSDDGVFLELTESDRFAPQTIALNIGLPEQRGERDGTYRSLVKNVGADEEAVLPLSPAQPFEGTITFEDTGKPAAHARLTIWASQQKFGSMSSVAGQADEQGRYRIIPHPGIRFGVHVYAPDGTPYLARETPLSEAIEWNAGDVVKHVDMALPRGVLVRGTVVEAGTNAPVANAAIQYHPESANNPNERDGILTGWQGIELSDEQGKFEIVVLPGPGRLLVHGPGDEYVLKETSSLEMHRGKPGGQRNYAHAIVRIDPAAGAGPVELDVELEPGATVSGRLVDDQARPIEEALFISRLTILPRSPFWRGYGGPAESAPGGKFELSGLGEGEEYTVYFLDPKRKLGTTESLRADSKDVTVAMKPCGQATARFVDREGNPYVGFTPSLYIVVTPGPQRFSRAAKEQLAADADFNSNVDRMNYRPGPKTDAQGQVTFPALIPGATYRIVTAEDGEHVIAKEFSVQSGETIDLGEVPVTLLR